MYLKSSFALNCARIVLRDEAMKKISECYEIEKNKFKADLFMYINNLNEDKWIGVSLGHNFLQIETTFIEIDRKKNFAEYGPRVNSQYFMKYFRRKKYEKETIEEEEKGIM